jgi:hypothetical protein
MVTISAARRILLSLPDTQEGAHMGHPDFRVVSNGRIFATLHADNQFGMVALTPEQQQRFMQEAPASFAPENGAWGRMGCTAARLDSVDEDTLGEAMTLAWQNAASKPAPRRSKTRKSRKPAVSAKSVKPERATKAGRPSRKR